MQESLSRALDTIRGMQDGNVPFDEAAYLAACAAVIDHRAELPYRVYIEIPGGLVANRDPRWDAVRAGSKERCSCGNERVILPMNQRTAFEASDREPVVVKGARDDAVYVKPRGGDKASTYVMLWIAPAERGPAFVFKKEPFAPGFFLNDLFSGPPAYGLRDLADAMAEQPGAPAIMFTGEKVPLFNITAVDPVAGTVTLTLDKDTELLTAEELGEEASHQH